MTLEVVTYHILYVFKYSCADCTAQNRAVDRGEFHNVEWAVWPGGVMVMKLDSRLSSTSGRSAFR